MSDAKKLDKARIEHYRYEMHTQLRRNWMSSEQHNDQASEINAICDLALQALREGWVLVPRNGNGPANHANVKEMWRLIEAGLSGLREARGLQYPKSHSDMHCFWRYAMLAAAPKRED